MIKGIVADDKYDVISACLGFASEVAISSVDQYREVL
jgi:hypothetical protein